MGGAGIGAVTGRHTRSHRIRFGQRRVGLDLLADFYMGGAAIGAAAGGVIGGIIGVSIGHSYEYQFSTSADITKK